MAPSRSATSVTWSLGTNKNSASGSTNFLMSQGQDTRSTLTCSRVIHFMAMCSFVLHWQLFTQHIIQGQEGLVPSVGPGNLRTRDQRKGVRDRFPRLAYGAAIMRHLSLRLARRPFVMAP